jgi:hypothetical protein
MFLKKTFALPLTVLLLQVSVLLHADSPEPAFNPQVSVQGEAANYLHGIEIRNADGSIPDSETTIESPSPTVIRLNLGLGDPMTKSIALHPRINGREFRVEQRYETSLTLMNEGPHMDLLDWKHYISEWEEVESRNGLTFLSKEVLSDEFPAVTQAEIIMAVRAESEKWSKQGFDEVERWIDLARQCTGPTTYPCGVSVSKITLRIRVKESGSWKDIQTIELQIPMGC